MKRVLTSNMRIGADGRIIHSDRITAREEDDPILRVNMLSQARHPLSESGEDLLSEESPGAKFKNIIVETTHSSEERFVANTTNKKSNFLLDAD